MDALDQMIHTETQELLRLQNSVVAQKIKVDALIAAASARPATRAATVVAKSVKATGGKPKGAISAFWRRVLNTAYQTTRPHSYQDIAALYEAEKGSAPDLSAIRDRVRNFIEWGFVEGNPETGFMVTEMAAIKFSFSKPALASEENGSHGSDASEPSAQGWGVSPPPPSNWHNPHSGPAS